MTKTIRITAALLAIFAFCIFCCGPLCQSAGAIAGIDDAVIAILIAALAAMGITFVASSTYQSLSEYVGTLLDEYASDRGTTISYELQGIQYGRNSLGKIIMNNRFVTFIQAFGAWLKVKFNLSNNSSVTVQSTGYYLGPATFYQSGSSFLFNTTVKTFTFEANDGSHWYLVFKGDKDLTADNIASVGDIATNCSYFFISPDASANTQVHYITRVSNNIDREQTRTPTGNFEGTWYIMDSYASFMAVNTGAFSSAFLFPNSFKFTGSNTTYSFNQQLEYLIERYDLSYNPSAIRIGTGDITLPYDDSDFEVGDGAILDVGATWGDTLGDILDQVIPGEFSEDNVANTSLTYEGEEEVADQVEESGPYVSNEASSYEVSGLADVFPFCIPFDLYNFVGCLAADPVAPSFEWRFYVPGIVDETITIDLAPYDSVAQILRSMELLLFCVGLAFVTRKIIRG